MLVCLSVNSVMSQRNNVNKKESPLFGIRTNRVINEKIENIKSKFFLNRIFFIQLQLVEENNNLRDRLQEKTVAGSFTCITVCDAGDPMTTGCQCITREITACIPTCDGPTCGHYCGK